MFGYKFKEWNWSQIRNVFYKKALTTGTLILNTVDGEVKISINRDGAEFAGEILRKLKNEAKKKILDAATIAQMKNAAK